MFPGKEHAFEPIEVIGSDLPSAHDVFEDDAVAVPRIFEPGDDCRHIGLVLDPPVAGHKAALAIEAYPEVECPRTALYLSLDSLPLASGEGL